jgi:hypothetical protein
MKTNNKYRLMFTYLKALLPYDMPEDEIKNHANELYNIAEQEEE